MAGKKENCPFKDLEIPQAVSGFITRFPSVAIATTTPHKVFRAKVFLGLAGYSGEVISLSAPSEPNNWTRPEEIAQEKVRQVAGFLTCPRKSLVIGTDVTICVNGDSSPLGKLHGEECDVYEQLLGIVGPQSLGVAEIRIGVAVFSMADNRGVVAGVYYPFSFEPLSAEGVLSYQKRHGRNVRKRAGGCDFTGEFAKRIKEIGGTPQSDNNFSLVLTDFKNAALGFPGREMNQVLDALASRNGGRDPWLRVYPSNPLFPNR